MPNWCCNTIEIEGPREAIDTFEKHLDESNGKEWFSYFIQIPEELKEDGWYEWNVENYGVKWNCDAYDWQRTGDKTILFVFDSPWGPPIRLYENIENIELEGVASDIDYYRINAQYSEEGMGFVGRFIDGEDEYYEYSDLASLDNIPEELVEHWGIRDRMEDDDEWLEEDDVTEEETVEQLDEIKAKFEKLMMEEDNVNEKTKN